MEDYKSKFTVKNFKEDLAQYFPLIHKIMQETSEIDLENFAEAEEDISEESIPVDDFAAFESWATSVSEGTLEPDTVVALKDLLDGGLTFGGPDATGAIEALQGIGVFNDALENALTASAQLNPEGDPKATILSWLMKDDPEAAQELSGEQAAEPAPAPAEMPPAPAPAEMPPAETPIAEGSAAGYNVTRFYRKYRNPSKISSWLKQQAGLPKDAKVYFDDADLVYGSETVVPEALVDDTLKFSDLLTALKQAIQSAPSEPEEGEDMENQESKPEGHQPSMKEIVEFIKPFYNKHAQEQGLGEWRKGPTELGIMAGKQFGSHVGKLVEKYVEQMQAKTEQMRSQEEATVQFEAIKKLAGLSRI